MRYSIIVIFIILSSCNPATNEIPDHRPYSQVSFIKKIASLDSVMQSSINEIVLDELADSTRKAMEKYCVDTLGGTFDNWEFQVVDIENEPMGLDVVKIDLMMIKKLQATSSHPEFSSIIFSDIINKSDKAKIDRIKKMAKGETVKISGEFAKPFEFTDHTSEIDPKQLFNNPEFSININ